MFETKCWGEPYVRNSSRNHTYVKNAGLLAVLVSEIDEIKRFRHHSYLLKKSQLFSKDANESEVIYTMGSREILKEQKEKTSRALIKAALELCANDGYASLSLRSVARKAGIAPTSFYRHFRDIDELGVAMIDEGAIILKKWLQFVKEQMTSPDPKENQSYDHLLESVGCLVRPFVELFIQACDENKYVLFLFFQELTGSSQTIRKAISEEKKQLITLLSDCLQHISQKSLHEFYELDITAEAMITLVSRCSSKILHDFECDRIHLAERMIQQINCLLIGSLIMKQIKEEL